MFPFLVENMGVSKVAFVSIWFLLVTLLSAQIYFIWQLSVWFLLIPVAVSRAPLWIFDMAETQIMQTEIPDGIRGRVNSVEYGLCSLMYIFSYGLTLIFNQPDQYIILSIFSLCIILVGCILYTIYFFKEER